ncbi:cdc42 effector protein 3 [Denticeps clupeoides]|uniref:cdc42 effector protein 3 n=1 Tax=Denticeps clupeoides TaxID=299321 RepID=UPI0010A30671|nr:cdc42 effector protein 3 [Denticeps clupeoides]
MPAKTPIYLKSTNSKKGKKCRLRDILSPDMISPPLGDFRHTIHIGKGGERDTFGDMSFLQGKFELLPGKGEVFRPQHSEFLRANSASDTSFTETPSPVLKNAISLPTIGGGQALTLPLITTTIFPVIPDPLEDPLVNPAILPCGPDKSDKGLEMLHIDALLQSITFFNTSPSTDQAKETPAFSINLMEMQEKPTMTKKTPKSTNVLSDGKGVESNPFSFFLNDNVNCNGSGHTKWKGCYNGNASLLYEKGHNNWADRDSGVEDSRISDFDFELSKGKGISQESLTQMTGSLLSLELDLGPSILDDVLNIMDKPKEGIKI